MPDVTIQCPTCGKTITVSEFADLSQLVCRGCGTRFAARSTDEELQAESPGPAGAETATAPEPAIPESPPLVITAKVLPRPPRRGIRWSYQVKCWLVFACVGAAALLLRHGGVLNDEGVGLIVEYGWLAVLALHLYIVFTAFRDSILTGILCLLIPFYSLYYVFWSFEDYMFRAVFGGILLGTGWDTIALAFAHAAKILPAMNDFFTSGL